MEISVLLELFRILIKMIVFHMECLYLCKLSLEYKVNVIVAALSALLDYIVASDELHLLKRVD